MHIRSIVVNHCILNPHQHSSLQRSDHRNKRCCIISNHGGHICDVVSIRANCDPSQITFCFIFICGDLRKDQRWNDRKCVNFSRKQARLIHDKVSFVSQSKFNNCNHFIACRPHDSSGGFVSHLRLFITNCNLCQHPLPKPTLACEMI